MAQIYPNAKTLAENYFAFPSVVAQKHYEALRAYFLEKNDVKSIAERYGFTLFSLYSLIRDFKSSLKNNPEQNPFFIVKKPGKKNIDPEGNISELVITLRKHYLSIPDIKAQLDAQGHSVSERYIWSVLNKEGFARLPRRGKKQKQNTIENIKDKIEAPKSETLLFESETFSTDNAGLLCFIPFIKRFGIDTIIKESSYPETKSIDRLSSILCFLSLKLSNIRRYSADDLWCMDRGCGLFARLNVLPKVSWYNSYSSRVIPDMNRQFLKQLHNSWKKEGLLSDTVNLDFTTIPYWGDDSHLENNWSGKRHKSLSSMLAVLAQDPDSGIIGYGDTTVRHSGQNQVIFEFIDFYNENDLVSDTLKYLVFDSKFTPYENLKKLDDRGIKFITIRRRGKDIVKALESLPSKDWRKVHVMNADGKGRTLKVCDKLIPLKGYGKQIRQIAITGHGKIKPALIITNDFKLKTELLIRKYSRRWIVEKSISEQIEFFHLNRVSSSMVIKVDFDLVMTILAHNIYRIFAQSLEGFSHQSDQSIYEKFIYNSGEVQIDQDSIVVKLKKKRNLPAVLNTLSEFQNNRVDWLGAKKIFFEGMSTT